MAAIWASARGDGPPGLLAVGDELGVVLSGREIEGQDAAVEVVVDHGQDLLI